MYPTIEGQQASPKPVYVGLGREIRTRKITMTGYYAAQRTFWVDPESGTSSRKRTAPIILRPRRAEARGDAGRYKINIQRGVRRVNRSTPRARSADGWRCGPLSLPITFTRPA